MDMAREACHTAQLAVANARQLLVMTEEVINAMASSPRIRVDGADYEAEIRALHDGMQRDIQYVVSRLASTTTSVTSPTIS